MTSPATPRILMLVIATGIFSFAGYAQEKPGKENLLTNASFAQGLQGWKVEAKAGNTAEVDQTELRDGRPTLKINNATGGHTHVIQKVTVKPNTRYRMTAYIKTKDVKPVKPGEKRGANLCVKNEETSKYVGKSEPWGKMELDFESGLRTEVPIGPQLGVYYDAYVGTAWFADLTLVEMGRSRK